MVSFVRKMDTKNWINDKNKEWNKLQKALEEVIRFNYSPL
jgi:hypothetical protein